MLPIDITKGITENELPALTLAACRLGWEEPAAPRISLDLKPGSGLEHYFMRLSR